MKKALIIVGIIAAGALVAFTLVTNKTEMEEQATLAQVKNETTSVVAKSVTKEQITDSFKATGNFEAFREITLSSLLQGNLIQIDVEKGDDVYQGQLIARLDADLFKADLVAAEANMVKTKKDLDRYEELAPRGAVTPQQVDDMRLAYKNAISRLESVKKQISNSTIKAPFKGTINERFVEPGSYIAAGGKIVELIDVGTLKIRVSVSESEVLKLKVGQKVTVNADALPVEGFDGKVSFIGVKADKSLRYPVEIQIKNNTKTLKAGMYGSATFTSTEMKEVLVIPREAIAGSLKQPNVYVIENGMAILRTIEIGTVSESGVEVLSGLKEGDQVVTDGQINLEDGDAITVVSK